MENFVYENPTKVVFGTGVVNTLGKSAKKYGSKALFVYGMNSIKKSGLYELVLEQLASENIEVIEHGGVKANPIYSHTKEGVDKARANEIDLIVAVGGGSVIDEAKAISIGAKGIDFWEHMLGKVAVKEATPIVSVLTMPATGSEVNGGFVIMKDKEKFAGNGGSLTHPRVSFLDPTYTLTIPKEQVAYAAADMLAHLCEPYFVTTNKERCVSDFYIEAVSKSIIDSAKKIQKDPNDLDARASFMWASSLAWNGQSRLGLGYTYLPCHAMEHPMSALYDIAHGAGLSMLIPAWLEYMSVTLNDRIMSFGKNILQVEAETTGEVIDALIDFYREIGAPTTWSEVNIQNPDYETLSQEAHKLFTLWQIKSEHYEIFDVENIYRLI
ncbi:MAG: iron-containing alcohol dehydrogenase [Opitutales bacterium]